MTSVQETICSLDYPRIIKLPDPCRLNMYSQKRLEAEPRTEQSRKPESNRGQKGEKVCIEQLKGRAVLILDD